MPVFGYRQNNGDGRTDTRADKNNAFLPNFVYSCVQFFRPRAPKVEQIFQNLKKCSTADSKSALRGSEADKK